MEKRHGQPRILIKPVNPEITNAVSFVSIWIMRTQVTARPDGHLFAQLGRNDACTFESQELNDRLSASVNVASGNLMLEATDLNLKDLGLDLSVGRT